MKIFLLYRDRNVVLRQRDVPYNLHDLEEDLDVDVLMGAMALEDPFLRDVARSVFFETLSDLSVLAYRQAVLEDCLRNAATVRELYALAVEAIEGEKKQYFGIFGKYPGSILRRSVDVLRLFTGILKKVRRIADEREGSFASEGFRSLFGMLKGELDDAYFRAVEAHLEVLLFRRGMLVSAGLGEGSRGRDYVLRRPKAEDRGWLGRLFRKRTREYAFTISDRDESGARALSELKERGINLVANALAQSAEHVLAFFVALRTELAFYVGCLNLYEHLARKGLPVSFPSPLSAKEARHSARGLYDVCLALKLESGVVCNDLDADGKRLVVITGANQGGKSTFLRALGVAQLMMQCGMFVPAAFFRASVCSGVHIHGKRREDVTMKSGKFDEELDRMSSLVDNLVPGALVLFNESFAATNEREGSEIAGQIVSVLVEKGMRVVFVTHLYEFARCFYEKRSETMLFLRAERCSGGERTFRITEGEPLRTSFGDDLYRRIFCEREAVGTEFSGEVGEHGTGDVDGVAKCSDGDS